MGSSAADTTDRLIDVSITEGHVAVLAPAVPLLEPVLQYTQRRFVAGGPMGHREVDEDVAMCEFDQQGRLCFAAGLLPRVRKILSEHGYRVRVDDQRAPGPRLAVDESVIDGSDACIQALLRAVTREPLGQIEASTDKDVLDKMILVAKLFPEARVVVAVATRKEAWKLWREMEGRLAPIPFGEVRCSVACSLSTGLKRARNPLNKVVNGELRRTVLRLARIIHRGLREVTNAAQLTAASAVCVCRKATRAPSPSPFPV